MTVLLDGRVQPASTGVVTLSPSVARRLHRLYVRTEMAAEMHQAAQAAFEQALIETFETEGLSMAPTDRFSIDWRAGTMTLRPGEGG